MNFHKVSNNEHNDDKYLDSEKEDVSIDLKAESFGDKENDKIIKSQV